MKNASAQKLWSNFLENYPEFAVKDSPIAFHFCDNEKEANICANLVCQNIKQATSSSLLGIQLRREELPKVGDFAVVTDWDGTARCIIRTTSVKLIPYFNICEKHVQLEGEGDKSLEYWQKTHWNHFTRELAAFEKTPHSSMIVVFETFEKLWS